MLDYLSLLLVLLLFLFITITSYLLLSIIYYH